jgi:hypothetical protein
MLIIVGCDNNSTNPTSQSKYPTQLGNQWEYQTTTTVEYYDSTGNIDSVEVFEFGNSIVRITSENDTVNGISNLVLFSSYEVNTTDSIHRSWYSNTDSGLYVIAYSGAGRAQPVIPKITLEFYLVKIAFSNYSNMLPNLPIYHYSSYSDSIFFFNPPRKVLAYPLSTNVRWVELEYPFYRERYVGNIKSVQVPAGVYNCYEIKSDWDFDIVFNDYISLTDGLVSRVLIADSMQITNPQGDTLLYARLAQVSQLVNKSF